MKTLMALKTCVVAAVAACAFASANAEAEETPSGYLDDWVSSDDATVRRIDLADGRAYVFTNTASAFQMTLNRSLQLAEVLVVGGGGSGGGCRGGGGGAGGLTNVVFAAAARPSLAKDAVLDLQVGAGGAHIAKGSWGRGNAGCGSSLTYGDYAWVVDGGGYGAGFNDYAGGDGACGGGGCNSGGKGGVGTLGGKGGDAPNNQAGGAGGGMGGDAKGETPGPGVTIDITGVNVVYSKGGDRGTNGNTDVPDAEAGTGNGGPGGMYGGGSVWGTAGGAGGSGTVIVKLMTDVNAMLFVEGDPDSFGTATPEYGKIEDLAQGVDFECTMKEEYVEIPGTGVRRYLSGWALHTIDPATYEITGTVRTSNDGALEGESISKCLYTHAGLAKLRWLWQRRDAVKVENIIMALGATGFEISANVAGMGYDPTPELTFSLAWGMNAAALDHTNEVLRVTTAGPCSGNVALAEPLASSCFAKLIITERDGTLAAEVDCPVYFVWTGAGANANASNPDNWMGGALPFKTGADILLDGAVSVKPMTWDLTDTVPASWLQTESYTGTVTLNTTQAAGGYGALEIAGDMRLDGGFITCPAPGSTGKQIVGLAVGGNLTLGTNGVIRAMGSKFSTYTIGYPGASVGSSSHGGVGCPKGSNTYADMKPCYGSIYAPTDYGSTGEPGESRMGGGGVIRISVAGGLRVDGLITASAWDSCYTAGSGGSVSIICGSICGTKGWGGGYGGIWAQGSHTWYNGIAGGGGRIALTLTDADATLADYDGWLSARGMGAGGNDQMTSVDKRFFSAPGDTRNSGAGTVYVREKGAAVDCGTLIVDNQTTLAKVKDGAVTEINATMSPDRTFGRIVAQGGGRLAICDGVTVETAAIEIGEEPGAITVADTAVVRLIGDAEGNASLNDDLTIPILEIDSSVRKLTVKAGKTITVTKSLKAVGTANEPIAIASDTPGSAFSLNVEVSAATSLDYLSVTDCAATDAPLSAQHSSGVRADGWKFITIDPGEVLTWTGAASSAWGDAGNWQLEGRDARTPVATDQIVIPGGTENSPTLPTVDVTVSNLTVAANASLTMSGFALTVDGALTVNGELTAVAEETITVGGALAFGNGAAFAAAHSSVVLTHAGEQTCDLGGQAFDKLVFATADGVMSVTGGFTASSLDILPGASLAFDAGSTVETTTFTALGTESKGIVLASATPGEKWNFTLKGLGKAAFITASDSDASSAMTVYAADSSGTDCVNWVWGDTRIFWTGAVSGDFADAANWKIGEAEAETAPGENDDVVVNAADCANQPVVSSATALGSVVVVSGSLRFAAPVEVARSVVVADGATLTVDKPLTVGGDFTALSGSTLTHTALPGTDKTSESYRFDVTVGGNFTLESGAVADLMSKGYGSRTGPGAQSKSYAHAGHGGNTSTWSDNKTIGKCYGSIFAPTNCGSGAHSGRPDSSGTAYVGGGAFVVRAGGRFTLDGSILARPVGWQDGFTASGGSVFITAGTIRGAGLVDVNGGWYVNNARSGGGGRVSFVLTEKGATFADFTAEVKAYGGPGVNGGTETKNSDAASGTIYWQDGNTAAGCGIVSVRNNVTITSGRPFFTDFGYDNDPMLLKNATLDLGRNARIRLLCDIHVKNLLYDDTLKVIDLNGYTLRVHAAKPKHWAETEAALVAAGKLVLGEGGKIRWNDPVAIIVR